MKNEGHNNLVPFTKGDPRINRNGRPRKFISELKHNGYTKSEVVDCIQVLMAMTLEELKEVFENDKATILEKTIANALFQSLKKGSLYSMEQLLNRVYGTPHQTTEVAMSAQINVLAPDAETAQMINNL